MSGELHFSKEKLLDKLRNMNSTQQSIELTAQHALFYRKEAKNVVSTWEQEYVKCPTDRKLVLLYLANHVLQESRKKGREFIDEFFRVMPRALKNILKSSDDKTRKSVNRLIDIWEERHVFNSTHIKSIRDTINGLNERPSRTSIDPHDERKKPQPIQALADALAEQETTAQRSGDMLARADPFFSKQDLMTTAPAAEVAAALEAFTNWGEALQSELASRQRAYDLLRKMLEAQEVKLVYVKEQLNMCTIQRENTQKRYTDLTSVGIAAGLAALSQVNFNMGIQPQFMAQPPQHVLPAGQQQPGPHPQPLHTFQHSAYEQHYAPPLYSPMGPSSQGMAMGPPGGMNGNRGPGLPQPHIQPLHLQQQQQPGVAMGAFGSFMKEEDEESPQAPQPEDSPTAPPMDDIEQTTPVVVEDDMPGLAAQLASSDASAQLLAQALEQLPPEDRDKFGLNIAEVLMNFQGGLELPAGLELPSVNDLGGGGDDDQYDPENPE